MKFGENLKKLRKAANMTQEQLAQRIGVQKQNISRYENGGREPNIKTAMRLADALGVSLEELTNGDDMLRALHTAEKRADNLNVLPEVYSGWSPDPDDDSSEPPATWYQIYTRVNHMPQFEQERIGNIIMRSLDKLPAQIPSVEAYNIAIAFDRADEKSKDLVRLTLKEYIEPITKKSEETAG